MTLVGRKQIVCECVKSTPMEVLFYGIGTIRVRHLHHDSSFGVITSGMGIRVGYGSSIREKYKRVK